jgi:hypothetical protein
VEVEAHVEQEAPVEVEAHVEKEAQVEVEDRGEAISRSTTG